MTVRTTSMHKSIRTLKEYRAALVRRVGYLEERKNHIFTAQMKNELAATKYAIEMISEDIIGKTNVEKAKAETEKE